jgi:dipeptidyl aminopeptidase/acylaminoacyl peptidase
MQTDPTPKILRATGAALLLLSACGGRSNMSDQTSCREPALAAAPALQPEIIAPPAPPAPIAPLGEHPFSARDLLAFARVSDPQVSPDGRRVAYVVRETDLEANRGRTEIWLGSADGSGAPVVLAAGAVGDHSPRWSPDGRTIYFLSRRSGSAQIWATSPEGGEPRQITDLPLPLSALVVAPDGQHLAFSAEVYLDCDTLACTAERLAAEAADPASGRRYDRLFARHWDTWKDGRRAHLFVIDQGGGAPIDVTAGLDADVPSKPFGGDEEITFTPDSQGLVFAARDVGAEEPWSTNFDLFYAPIRGRAAPRRLTDNPAWDTRPRFSPDGATLYYLAMRRPGFEADRFAILARPWPEGQPTEIAPSWDRSPHDLEVSADGRTLYVTADHLGRAPLFAIDAASGQARELVSDGYQSAPKRAGDHLLFLRDHLRSPAELHRVPLAGGALEPITQINRQRLANARMGEPEQFTFPGWKGEPVHAWLVKPVDYRPDQKYPLVLLIHGGPQGSFGDHFHYRWNPQTYAGRRLRRPHDRLPRLDRLRPGLHRRDLRRLGRQAPRRPPGRPRRRPRPLPLPRRRPRMRPRGQLRRLHDQLDRRQLARQVPLPRQPRRRLRQPHDVLRHRGAMVPGVGAPRPLLSERRRPRAPQPRAPRRALATPMLVIHGSLDYRIPETQGLAAFTALQRRGVPSRLVVFPDENHWVLKPANSLQWHDEVGTWLDTWLRGS